jgi:hypothetical protein
MTVLSILVMERARAARGVQPTGAPAIYEVCLILVKCRRKKSGTMCTSAHIRNLPGEEST